ncbi:MAG: 2-deoxy-5-keto-D-gluconate 6-phosphate aldolase domain-containing protein [Chloroflexota bacterium]
MLAFDHRASFTHDLFGLSATPTPTEAAQVSEAKEIIFEGFLQVLAAGAPRDAPGVLVDEAFGSEVAGRARAAGVLLAMPVEASGRKEFDFEYGDAFGEHIERFDPAFAKVLVRYNPEDPEGNATQTERLKRLSDWLHARGRLFLFELLVPATSAQLAAVGGDSDRYDREARPELMVRAVAELQDAGVEPDIWKIEGLETREDGARVAEQARSGGRSRVCCVVLGRGASQLRVEHWLRTAAPVSGFIGFAVGRTIWMDSLMAYRHGSITREATAERIAAAYLRAIEVYRAAAAGGGDGEGSGPGRKGGVRDG